MVATALTVVLLAQAPLPMLLVGTKDAWGVPLDTADKVALRKMLVKKDFATLTKTLEALQAISEEDCSRELVGLDAFDTFASADPSLGKLFTAWLEGFPDSWVPLLARGQWYVASAVDARGMAYVAQTPKQNLEKLKQLGELGRADLMASIEKHDTLSARRGMLTLSQYLSLDFRPHAAAAVALCPSTFQLRMKVMAVLRPEWGGSYEAMQAYAADAPVDQNPKLKILAGRIYSAECGPDDLAACDKALAIGRHWEFLYDKAEALGHTHSVKNEKLSIALIDEALKQRPQKSSLHSRRAYFLFRQMRVDEAERALKAAAAIDPWDVYLR